LYQRKNRYTEDRAETPPKIPQKKQVFNTPLDNDVKEFIDRFKAAEEGEEKSEEYATVRRNRHP
jgi:hypothetical protein